MNADNRPLPDESSAVSQRITHLRAQFLARLPDRINEAWQLLALASVKPYELRQFQAMHRFWHSLKGAARSFGFREIAEAAILGSNTATRLLDEPEAALDGTWQQGIVDAIKAISHAAPTVDTPSPEKLHKVENTLPVDTPPPPTRNDEPVLIYLCHDDQDERQRFSSQLECFNYRTETFPSPQALIAATLAKRPGLIILDTHFPDDGGSGIEAMTLINREFTPSVPAIFLSTCGDFETRLGAVRAGGDAYFLKPVPPLALIASMEKITQQDSGDPYRVLVMDDQQETADYHCILLQAAGIQTRRVSQPNQVLDVLAEFQPDLVLTDLYQPDCTGRDLARLIRQVPSYIGMPIVFLSSETDQQKQFSAMRAGVDGFLVKPVSSDELISAVIIRCERTRILRALMDRDGLCGLFNHSTLSRALEQSSSLATRRDTEVCFVMIDIDRFKAVNDTYGHPVGDQVIVTLARVIQQRVRHSDIAGRYGGEEFAIILNDTDLPHAWQLIEEIRYAFAAIRFSAPEGEFSSTFSAGIASNRHHATSAALREAADQLLYRAKRSGRNRTLMDKE